MIFKKIWQKGSGRFKPAKKLTPRKEEPTSSPQESTLQQEKPIPSTQESVQLSEERTATIPTEKPVPPTKEAIPFIREIQKTAPIIPAEKTVPPAQISSSAQESKYKEQPTSPIEASAAEKITSQKSASSEEKYRETSPSPKESSAKKPIAAAKIPTESSRNRLGARLRRLLGITSASFTELAEQIEEELLLADFGVATTQKIIESWRARGSRGDDKERLIQQLRAIMSDLLTPIEKPLLIGEQRPFCLRMIGANGVGKTTTLAKIAHHYKQEGFLLHLVAGDTFRAAAIDQLRVWGERLEIEVTHSNQYADSAATIYDGLKTAQEQAVDLVIVDTIGMMASAQEMTSYMQKVSTTIRKLIPDGPHESLLVLDASHGQSALMQAQGFCAATSVDGFCLTKMDSSAKGGVVFAMATEYQLPLRFIGTGERVTDLQPFSSAAYLNQLISSSPSTEQEYSTCIHSGA